MSEHTDASGITDEIIVELTHGPTPVHSETNEALQDSGSSGVPSGDSQTDT